MKVENRYYELTAVTPNDQDCDGYLWLSNVGFVLGCGHGFGTFVLGAMEEEIRTSSWLGHPVGTVQKPQEGGRDSKVCGSSITKGMDPSDQPLSPRVGRSFEIRGKR